MSIQLVKDGSYKEAGQGLSGEIFHPTARHSGFATLAGTITMLIGAALWGTSGTDLWAALETGDVAGYLAAAGAVKAQLVANLSVWILGTFIIGIAGTMLAALCTRRRALVQAALVCYRTAVPLVIVSYIAMLAVVVQLGGDTSATAVSLAEVVGWIGVRADYWFLDIDWEDPDAANPGSIRSGSTSVQVFQPTVRFGWRKALSGVQIDVSTALGAEINVQTEGEAVGQGAILLVGLRVSR